MNAHLGCNLNLVKALHAAPDDSLQVQQLKQYHDIHGMLWQTVVQLPPASQPDVCALWAKLCWLDWLACNPTDRASEIVASSAPAPALWAAETARWLLCFDVCNSLSAGRCLNKTLGAVTSMLAILQMMKALAVCSGIYVLRHHATLIANAAEYLLPPHYDNCFFFCIHSLVITCCCMVCISPLCIL